MIFREELIPKILVGEKTVTRRPVKYLDGPGRDWLTVPCRYKPGGGPGGTYALQGPPEKDSRARARTIPSHRLRVLDVRRGLLIEVGADEARAEGFLTVVHFRRYWCRLYGLDRFDGTQLVDRIEFEPVETAQKPERAA